MTGSASMVDPIFFFPRLYNLPFADPLYDIYQHSIQPPGYVGRHMNEQHCYPHPCQQQQNFPTNGPMLLGFSHKSGNLWIQNIKTSDFQTRSWIIGKSSEFVKSAKQHRPEILKCSLATFQVHNTTGFCFFTLMISLCVCQFYFIKIWKKNYYIYYLNINLK